MEKQIPIFKVYMSSSAPEEVGKVLMSGFIGQGQKVEEFENLLESHFQLPFINTVYSCTGGLELAIHMLKNNSPSFTANDEIITTPLTCTATNTAILAKGVKLRWADVDPNTCNIDLNDVERKVNKNTKAIMIVHWGGYPVNLERLREIQYKCCKLYGHVPHVIEDCAHAWGAKYQNKYIGAYGNFSVFSFQAIKHLTTGDGGIIISPNDTYHQRAKLLRWYGLDRTNTQDFRCAQNINEAGFKSHMNDIAATIGICNFKETHQVIEKHKENGNYYNEVLKDVEGIKLLENDPDCDSSYWVYTIMVDKREKFMKGMTEKGIATSQVHARNDKHPCFREFRSILPGVDHVSKHMCCIPSGWWLTKSDRQYVAKCIKECV